MEERLRAEFPAYLLERGVQYHTRKGLRKDCDCEYCTSKYFYTRHFYNNVLFTIRQNIREARKSYFWNRVNWQTEDFWEVEKYWQRKFLAENVRNQLNILKQFSIGE